MHIRINKLEYPARMRRAFRSDLRSRHNTHRYAAGGNERDDIRSADPGCSPCAGHINMSGRSFRCPERRFDDRIGSPINVTTVRL